jgi:hypothetical protein
MPSLSRRKMSQINEGLRDDALPVMPKNEPRQEGGTMPSLLCQKKSQIDKGGTMPSPSHRKRSQVDKGGTMPSLLCRKTMQVNEREEGVV